MAVAIVLAVVMTWPLAARPGSVARFDTNDGKFSLWNVAWVAHALTTNPATLFDANIFHPTRHALAFSEANLVAGTMAVPVYLVTGNPIAAHNVVVFVALVLACLLTWQLVRRFTRSAWAPMISATAFAFSAFVSAHTAHVQLLMVFVLPLTFLALHRFVEQPTMRRGVALGLALVVAGLSCAYYGIMAGVAVGLGILWFAVGQPKPRQYWIGTALALVVMVGVVAPIFMPYLSIRRDTGFKAAVDLNEANYWSADLRAYRRSAAIVYRPLNVSGGPQSAGDRDREVLFPGLVVLLFAAAGVFAALRTPLPAREAPPAIPRRVVAFYLFIALFFFWASFGPAAGLYRWIAEVVPFMSFLRAPARWGAVVLLAVSVLAGIGIQLMVGRRRWLVAVLLLVVAVEVKAVWPLLPVPEVPEAYRRLATLPRGPVVEFHFPYRESDLHNHAKFMYWSMWHWQPLVNGYSDYIPEDFRQIRVPINGFPNPESFEILRARQVRYVVLHTDTYTPASVLESMLARFPPYEQYLRPIVRTGNIWLYEIVRYP